MPEPHVSTVAGASLALGTVTITGSVLGMQVDALLVGFVFASFSVLLLEPQGVGILATLRAAVWVGLGMMLASLLSPWAIEGAAFYLKWIRVTDAGRLAMAALIGLVTPVAVPMLKAWGKRKVEAA